MTRPCYLVVDQEFATSISTRKLVIETAKFNVITAYSAEEAISTLKRFPNISGIVLDAGVNIPSVDLVKTLKEIDPTMTIILVGRPGTEFSPAADYHLSSFDPSKILILLQKLQPEQVAAIEKRNESLSENR